MGQEEIAKWSGRKEVKQNRVYSHMSEFELVAMVRSHDTSLTLDLPLQELAQQVAQRLPVSRQAFNAMTMPTAHVTEYGFCVHDFTVSPCQRFRDCLNCTEQICIKGDKRLQRIKARYQEVLKILAAIEEEKAAGSAGADRWFEIHELTANRLAELIAILEDPKRQDGTLVRLRNDKEFSPMRRALAASTTPTTTKVKQDHPPVPAIFQDLQDLL